MLKSSYFVVNDKWMRPWIWMYFPIPAVAAAFLRWPLILLRCQRNNYLKLIGWEEQYTLEQTALVSSIMYRPSDGFEVISTMLYSFTRVCEVSIMACGCISGSSTSRWAKRAFPPAGIAITMHEQNSIKKHS